MGAAKVQEFNGETYYPVKQAAEMLGVHWQTLHDWINAGKVRVSLYGTRRVSSSEIDRILRGEPLPRVDIQTQRERERLAAKNLEALRKKGW